MNFPPRNKIPSVPIVDTPRPREHPRSKGGDGNAVPRAMAEEATTRRNTSSSHRTTADSASIYAISSRHPQPQPPDPPSLQLSLRTSRPQRLQGGTNCHDKREKNGDSYPRTTTQRTVGHDKGCPDSTLLRCRTTKGAGREEETEIRRKGTNKTGTAGKQDGNFFYIIYH